MKNLMSSDIDCAAETYKNDTHVKPATPVIVAQDIGSSKVVSTGYIARNDTIEV